MNAQLTLNPSASQLLTSQTGQLLVILGNILAQESVACDYVSGRTSQTLVRLGRKLIHAGKCGCNN